MNEKICIIKLGSTVLAENVDLENRINDISIQLSKIIQQGWFPILVSSGAVSTAKQLYSSKLKLNKKTQKRVLASLGQVELISTYKKYIKKLCIGYEVAQILLVREAFSERDRYIALRESLLSMLNNKIVPIINNNDVVHSKRIDFSDNDHMAAYIAVMVDANALVLVTDVYGIYDRNPKHNKSAQKIDILTPDIKEWPEIAIDNMAISSGGMKSKIDASKLMMNFGMFCRIISKDVSNFIVKALDFNNREGTSYIPVNKKKKFASYRKWLLAGALPKGILIVSPLGANAISRGTRASLLAIGAEEVYGEFEKGDILTVRNGDFHIIGVGKTKFSSREINKIIDDKIKDNTVVVHADEYATKVNEYFLSYDRNNVKKIFEECTLMKYQIDATNGIFTVKKKISKEKLITKIEYEYTRKDMDAAKKIGVNLSEWLLYKHINKKIL